MRRSGESNLLAGLAALLLCVPADARGQEIPACTDTVIVGHVEAGEAFEARLAPGLVFRLDPEVHPQNPQGWTIRVTPESEPGSDYSMVATPPYRFSNPRYVNTGYGITAEAAIAWTPRRFSYVATDADYEAAQNALEILLWSGGRSAAEIASAQNVLDGLQLYRGELRIEGASTTTSVGDATPPVIEWIDFRAILCRDP